MNVCVADERVSVSEAVGRKDYLGEVSVAVGVVNVLVAISVGIVNVLADVVAVVDMKNDLRHRRTEP